MCLPTQPWDLTRSCCTLNLHRGCYHQVMQADKSLPLPKDMTVQVQLLARGVAEGIAEPSLLTGPLLKLPQLGRAAASQDASESRVAARAWPLNEVLEAVNEELPRACIHA